MLERIPTSEELKQNMLLRQEAGEGWHEGGLDTILLGAIVSREELLECMLDAHQQTSGVMRDEYIEQAKLVKEIKDKKGVGFPPPLPIPEE